MAWNVDPSFRIRVTSSSNFPFTEASFKRRGTRVGTFRGTWKLPTFIFPRTSWRGPPERASPAPPYLLEGPLLSPTITGGSPGEGLPPHARAPALPLPRGGGGPPPA